MIPGMVGRFRELTIVAAASVGPIQAEVVRVSGTTGINTIVPNFGGQFAQEIRLIGITGDVALGTTGNVLAAATVTSTGMTILTYVPSLGYWVKVS